MTDYISDMSAKLRLDELDQNENLYFIQKYLGVKPSSFLVALTIFVVIVSLTSNATNIVVSIVCCLIPAYFTFLSLESPKGDTHIKYLTYWILFSLLQAISPFFTLVLTSFLYVTLRIALTVALLHPSLDISVKIYREYVEPELVKYQRKIDGNVQKGKEIVDEQYKRFSRN